MTDPTRRVLLAGLGAGAVTVAIAGCSGTDSDAGDSGSGDDSTNPSSDQGSTQSTTGATSATLEGSHALGGDAAALAAATSALLLTRSPVAVLCPDDPALVPTAAALAREGHWPVLIAAGAGEPLPEPTSAELARLGVEQVIVVTPAPSADAASSSEPAAPRGLDDVEVHLVPAGPSAAIPDDIEVGPAPTAVDAVVVAPAQSPAAAAVATAEALGAAAHVDLVDAREDATVMAALRSAPDRPVVALGADQSVSDRLLATTTMAQRAPELPGGGVTVFPGRRLVALYGHPSGGALGLLGEQGVEGSIERINGYVQAYAPLVPEKVVPAWEIIASVATGGPGDDGNYSRAWEPDYFRSWVDAARAAGVYVVLDLQPGRNDFLTQAKIYEQLLLEPHVGLALDPEWRIGPDERHLTRIGHVEADEVNQVSEWLAHLVRAHDLPQKVLTLHQFTTSMIRNRELVRTDHPELAVVLHADGQGTQGGKQGTWNALKADLPAGMWLGWKNFYDEDAPMLTPEETVAQVDPTPWFISYQ